MAGTITHADKFHRVFTNVSSTGTLADGCGDAFKVLEETTLRVTGVGLDPANVVTVRGRLLDQVAWTDLDTVTGNESKVIPIHTWDEIQFDVTTYGGTVGSIVTSGFYESRTQELIGAIEGEFTPQGLNVALKVTKATITDTATAVPLTALSDRNSMIIRNESLSDSIFIGNSDVTASGSTEGWELLPNSFFSLDIKDSIQIYAIAATGISVPIKVLELA